MHSFRSRRVRTSKLRLTAKASADLLRARDALDVPGLGRDLARVPHVRTAPTGEMRIPKEEPVAQTPASRDGTPKRGPDATEIRRLPRDVDATRELENVAVLTDPSEDVVDPILERSKFEHELIRADGHTPNDRRRCDRRPALVEIGNYD